jgi:hypothetical protein
MLDNNEMPINNIVQGDAISILKTLTAESVDNVQE